MDIVALAAIEQVTLRTRFQTSLAELQACQGRFAPPTLTALMRAPCLPAALSIQPQLNPAPSLHPNGSPNPAQAPSGGPPSNAPSAPIPGSPSLVPPLHLNGVASGSGSDLAAGADSAAAGADSAAAASRMGAKESSGLRHGGANGVGATGGQPPAGSASECRLLGPVHNGGVNQMGWLGCLDHDTMAPCHR